MPWITRSKAAKNTPVVDIGESDSEPLSQEKPASKRQKTGLGSQHNIAGDGDRMDVDPEHTRPTQMSHKLKVQHSYDPNKNAHLKGRKRFTADFADVKEACGAGLILHGLKLKKVRPGDDEGSFEVVIENEGGKHVLSANLFVSDTSEYPRSHSLFCYSPDADISSRLQRVIRGSHGRRFISDSQAIQGTIQRRLISKNRGRIPSNSDRPTCWKDSGAILRTIHAYLIIE